MVHSVKIEDNKRSVVGYIADLSKFSNGSSFTFKEGVNIIIGENGSGKSTLLNIIKKYLLVDTNECSKGLYNSNINEVCRFTKFDGVHVYADYQRNTFRLSHKDEETSDDILKDHNSFCKRLTQNSSSTGESVVVALNSLFNYIFSSKANLTFDYSQFADNYPEYYSYVQQHTKAGNEWTILMDEPDRNLSIDNINNIASILKFHKENTQLIVSIHNPILIYHLSKFKHINWIEMSDNYLTKVKSWVDKLTK